MKESQYRVATENIISGEDLVNGLVARVDCGPTPQNRRHPIGLWFCDNIECDARDVQVGAKYLRHPPPASPPAMKCPCCGETLRFEHYLAEQLLLPSTLQADEPFLLTQHTD
jgi:hypothetical protein